MTRTEKKTAFLEEVCKASPEYREILGLFKEIYSYVSGRESVTGISFKPKTEHKAEKVKGGLPLLTPDDLRVEVQTFVPFLTGLIAVMAQHSPGGAEDLNRLSDAVSGGKLDLQGLLKGCFVQERRVVEEAAAIADIPAPLIDFVFETALKTSLEQLSQGFSEEDFAGWHEKYCPLCGSRPGMAELVGEEGRRYLSCAACSFSMPFKRLSCPFCENEDPEKLSYFTVDEGPTRVDICKSCSRYIKTRDSRKGNGDVPLEAMDPATIHLDLVAVREGYARGNDRMIQYENKGSD